jgi:hypothetical protein
MQPNPNSIPASTDVVPQTMPDLALPNDKYIAKMQAYIANETADDLAGDLVELTNQFSNFQLQQGRYALYRRSYMNYYYGQLSLGRILAAGTKGQFTKIFINHYQNILEHLVISITNQRPALKAKPINSDYKSLAQCKIADGVINYWLKQKNLEGLFKTATLYSFMFGCGLIEVVWNEHLGDETMPDDVTGQMGHEGDVDCTVISPLDIFFDTSVDSWEKLDWIIVRKWKNRYQLAAMYPDKIDKILAISNNSSLIKNKRLGHPINEMDTDIVPFYTFYHKKDLACPEGREYVFLDDSTWLDDKPLIYDDIPLHRMASMTQVGSAYGYTVGFELLAVQEAINDLYTAALSNEMMFGTQNILLPKGAAINWQSLGGALRIIDFDPAVTNGMKPEALQLCATPPEVFNMINQLRGDIETLSGVNAVVRGQTPTNLTSGSALALVASQSINFNSSPQQAYSKMVESVASALINIVKKFAKTPRIALISGVANQSYLDQFTADKLNGVSRIECEEINPLSTTTAGRMQMASDLIQAGQITNPKMYLEVVKTGNLEVLDEGDEAELLLIKAENEMIMNGDVPIVNPDDDHVTHLKGHKQVMADPKMRKIVNIKQAYDAHQQLHLQALAGLNPILAGLFQQPVLNHGPQAPGQPQPPQAGGPMAPKPPMPPKGPTPNAAKGVQPQNGILAKAQAVRQPSMPKNPVSGQPFSNQPPLQGR